METSAFTADTQAQGLGEIVALALDDGEQPGVWVIPRIPHTEQPVGPRVLPGGLIRRAAGTSEPWHARVYAQQLLAAADAAEREQRRPATD